MRMFRSSPPDFAALRRCCFLLLIAGLVSGRTRAQSPSIDLFVDASHAPEKILTVRESLPVTPGRISLYYTKWIQGVHAPVGPIGNLAGLKVTANGKTLAWTRDLDDAYTFHVEAPAGVSKLDLAFEYLESAGLGGPAGGSATNKLLDLNWFQVVLYPSGAPAARISVTPKLRLPANWRFGTALPVETATGAEIVFKSVSLDRFLDSPLIAGEFYRSIDLTPRGEPIHHEIDIVADSATALAMSTDVQKGLTNLVAESGALFGARHYREYHFLLTLSDHTAHFGVEHHESNDSRLPERILISPGAAREVAGLLAHEFAHSWSGKFRRPKMIATPDFQTPMETDLLWVYEGNTSYLGDLLAARSGLWTADDYHQAMASYAAALGPGRPGRTWRPVLDTASAVPAEFTGGPGGGWLNYRRGSDYYEEGELLWLEAATLIHEQSGGRKSLEDFFHLFYGGANNGPEVKPYTFDQLMQTFDQVLKYDWAGFWNSRLHSTSPQAPVGGIEASGWKLVFTGEPPSGGRTSRNASDTTFTIGLTLSRDGTISDVIYGGPAFRGGAAPGMKVAGVNGRVYTPEILSDAIAGSKESSQPIELLLIDNDYYRNCSIDYHGGKRFPHLERDASKPDYLADLLKSEAAGN